MLFTKLKLNYFGRFQNREIELKPGINLIYGENEAGKSTIHTFIKGMLFGIERLRGRGAASKDDLYTRYLPWDYPGAFNGQMDVLIQGKEYRLQRSFHANDKGFTILDLDTGREVKLKEGLISELLPGLTESTFKNTISIEQLKAQTDAELASQVRNYITNLSIAKSKEVNVAKAVSSLTEQKKALDTTQITSQLKLLQSEIEEGIEREEKIDALTLRLRELLSEEQELKSKKEAILLAVDNEASERIEQLPAIIEKYRSYKELAKQSLSMENQREELQEKIARAQKESSLTDTIKEDLAKLQRLNLELPEYEKNHSELKMNSEASYRGDTRKNRTLGLLLGALSSIIAFIVTFFMSKSIVVSAVIAGSFMIAGCALMAVLNKSCRQKKQEADRKAEELFRKVSELKQQINGILLSHKVTSVLELGLKQEELLKQSYSLEHNRAQLTELINRKSLADDNRDLLHDKIMTYMQYFITEEELSDNSIQRLQEVIRQRKQETAQKLAENNRQYDECKLQIEKLRWELSSMEGNEAQLIKNKERYTELEQKQAENTVELEAVKLALSTIQELSADIHDSFGRQLNQAVSDIIGNVTEQKYTDLKIDEKLDVKVGWNGDYVLLDRLSAGTMDQVYFALRLAVADLLLGKDEVPLLFDDSFALYDENRVKAALRKVADRKQILLFSCHSREKRILEEMNLPYHLIDLSSR